MLGNQKEWSASYRRARNHAEHLLAEINSGAMSNAERAKLIQMLNDGLSSQGYSIVDHNSYASVKLKESGEP